jgi:hypothetical protein
MWKCSVASTVSRTTRQVMTESLRILFRRNTPNARPIGPSPNANIALATSQPAAAHVAAEDANPYPICSTSISSDSRPSGGRIATDTFWGNNRAAPTTDAGPANATASPRQTDYPEVTGAWCGRRRPRLARGSMMSRAFQKMRKGGQYECEPESRLFLPVVWVSFGIMG